MAYIANPVNFDGTNDYLLRGGVLTGTAASRLVTFSFWVRKAATGVSYYVVQAQSAYFHIQLTTANVVQIRGETTGGTLILDVATSVTLDTNWHHVAGSFDTNAASLLKQLCVDGVQSYVETVFTNDTPIAFNAPTDWAIGATVALAAKLNGDIADLLMWTGVKCDLSVASNMAMFFANGSPVDPAVSIASLGTPKIAQYGATGAWHTNKGSAGGFTLTGAITDGAVPLPLGAGILPRRISPALMTTLT